MKAKIKKKKNTANTWNEENRKTDGTCVYMKTNHTKLNTRLLESLGLMPQSRDHLITEKIKTIYFIALSDLLPITWASIFPSGLFCSRPFPVGFSLSVRVKKKKIACLISPRRLTCIKADYYKGRTNYFLYFWLPLKRTDGTRCQLLLQSWEFKFVLIINYLIFRL